MCNYIYFPIKKIFRSKRGNDIYTKAYCSKIPGEYEVYTGTTKGVFAKINHYNIDKPTLTFTTDGEYAGTVSLLTGKYTIGGHRAILYPIVSDIYLPYFRWILPSILLSAKRSNCVPTITWNLIKDLLVPIPIDNNGKYNVEKQKEIAEKYELINKKRDIIIFDKETLLQTKVELDLSSIRYISLSVEEIFDLDQKTNSSEFTKTFIKNNPGNIPVYGASKVESEVGYGYVCDNAEIKIMKSGKQRAIKVKYFENCLTYNIDASAGYVFYRRGKFSLSEKVRPLIICDKYKHILDPEYLRFVLQPVFRANIRGRRGANGENEYTKIGKTTIKSLLIPIPINSNGDIDLQIQKKIASQYLHIEQIKHQVCKQIDSILKINIDI